MILWLPLPSVELGYVQRVWFLYIAFSDVISVVILYSHFLCLWYSQYFSLNKASYWRILQRNAILREKQLLRDQLRKKQTQHKSHELVSSESKLKRINHAVMQLKIEPKRKKKGRGNAAQTAPKPEDIYQQCMQQLQVMFEYFVSVWLT